MILPRMLCLSDNVRPGSSQYDAGYLRLAHVVLLGKSTAAVRSTVPSVLGTDFYNQSIVQFCRPMLFSSRCRAMIVAVGSVVGSRAPSQIGQMVITWVSVWEVARFASFWTRTNERLQHQAMNQPCFRLAADARVDVLPAKTISGLTQLNPPPPSAIAARPNIASICHGIAWKLRTMSNLNIFKNRKRWQTVVDGCHCVPVEKA